MLRLEAIASGQAYLRLECRSWLADIATEGPEALEVFLAALKDILRGVNYRKRCSQRSPDFIFEPPGKVYGRWREWNTRRLLRSRRFGIKVKS